ncbi:hypothetical protein Ahy_B09g096616 [Arachis hypogaea]|uniref:Aminotransferase-like plant mobile domain-containing protein n=1 Tax=Arachis hypogaea TaxID=3818 RepID=A0A444XLS5_ARAHY|nr:hypothetical protein Ahy_B09g096616 [Arachis hypogaea]
MSQTDDPKTLRQYTRCYIMLLIGGYLMTDKSNNLVHIHWLPLLRDFDECRSFSWGSAVLAWTYQSLSLTAQQGVTDITGCTPLLMSCIYQRFFQWCPSNRGVYQYPLHRCQKPGSSHVWRPDLNCDSDLAQQIALESGEVEAAHGAAQPLQVSPAQTHPHRHHRKTHCPHCPLRNPHPTPPHPPLPHAPESRHEWAVVREVGRPAHRFHIQNPH